MAAKKSQVDFTNDLSTTVEIKDDGYKGPRVEVFLPRLEDSDSEGINVDQYEHVTIANEAKTETYYVLRGERVDVPAPVFMVLKERYPKL